MELTIDDIKKVWISEEAVHMETISGEKAVEYFADYPKLRNANIEEKKNFKQTPFGLYWEDLDEELSYSGFFEIKIKRSPMGELFDFLDVLNVSAFARRLGIPQPLMAAYLSGSKKPSKKRKEEIAKELHKIGKELQQIEI